MHEVHFFRNLQAKLWFCSITKSDHIMYKSIYVYSNIYGLYTFRPLVESSKSDWAKFFIKFLWYISGCITIHKIKTLDSPHYSTWSNSIVPKSKFIQKHLEQNSLCFPTIIFNFLHWDFCCLPFISQTRPALRQNTGNCIFRVIRHSLRVPI